MKRVAVQYWDEMGSAPDAQTRDSILCGFRTERSFDDAGEEDASHLILPFIGPDDVVVDIGCGIGRLLKWVAPHCRRVHGLDVSRTMLEKAKHRCRHLTNVTFRRLPLSLRFPLESGSVDFAYFYHVSEHMDREDAFMILREMRRVLRRSGRALVQFSLLRHPDNQRQFQRWAVGDDVADVRSRFYTEPEAELILGLADLHPQLRLYIPGEYAVIVTKTDKRQLGAMPLVRLPRAKDDRREPATSSIGKTPKHRFKQ